MKSIIFFTAFLHTFLLWGQSFERLNIPTTENGSLLSQAWTGGLNSCLFSEIDFNLDGVKDLLLFDKSSNRVLPFIKNSNSYNYQHEFVRDFPEPYEIHFPWMQAIDYNCDNKNDLFVFNGVGLSVYKNTSMENLSFELITDFLPFQLDGNTLSLFVLDNTFPYIGDFDNDGDIDIMSFSSFGLATVHYYKNKSIENTGYCGLELELETDCWGNFNEAGGFYALGSCGDGEMLNRSSSSADGAYTMNFIDIDADQDQDLLLGHDIVNNINLLFNNGDNEIASISSDFPVNTVTASINKLPAVFHIDINDDNLKDLIVSPFLKTSSENFESNWLYTNTGTSSAPVYELTQNNFIQENTIDLGESAYPTVFDYNNDGLLDLVVGNYGYYQSNGNYTSSLALFENTGTIENPAYNLVNRDFAQLSSIPLNTILDQPTNGLIPTFGDLDNDGDKDLIIGDANGMIHYFKNTANGEDIASFELENVNYFDIDVGNRAAPILFDINNDNLLDLLIGERDGSLNYIPNTGDANNPNFTIINENFGNINTTTEQGQIGNATPYCYIDNNELKFIIGSESGHIYIYNNITNNLEGSFTLTNTINLIEGKRTSPCYIDMNNDDKKDLIIGNIGGGLAFYQGTEGSSHTEELTHNTEIYPNPSKSNIHFKSDYIGSLSVYGMLGQEVYHTQKDKQNITLEIHQLQKGMYFIKTGSTTHKFIKQ